MTKISTDLDLMIEYRERLDALDKAKSGKDADKLRKAKDELRAFRQEWREVRDSFSAGGSDGDGTASPEPVSAKGKVN